MAAFQQKLHMLKMQREVMGRRDGQITRHDCPIVYRILLPSM